MKLLGSVTLRGVNWLTSFFLFTSITQPKKKMKSVSWTEKKLTGKKLLADIKKQLVL